MILRAHSNLTCGKNIGNASNASSQQIMSVVFRKENYTFYSNFAPLDPVYMTPLIAMNLTVSFVFT